LKRAFSMGAIAYLLAVALSLQGQQYVFRAFRQENGLKNLSINGMAMDSNGFLWVATENGVYRFLGSGFRRYGSEDGLVGMDVRDIVSDPQGTVWVGTEEDLFRWNGVRFVSAGSKPISIVGSRRIGVEDSEHLLVVDKGRLYRLEHDPEGRMRSYLPAIPEGLSSSRPDLQHIVSVSVLQDRSHAGEIWIGSGKQLYLLPRHLNSGASQTAVSMAAEWGPDKGLPADEWQQVVVDRNGTLWAAGLKHVSVLLPGAERFVDRNIDGTEHQNTFGHASLVEDPEGRMLAPAGAWIARWNAERWEFIGRSNGLTRFSANIAMVFDRTGDLFVAGRGDGLYLWPGYADWEGWNSEQSLPSTSIWAIVPTRAHRVFLGTEDGPAWIDRRTGKSGPLPFAEKFGLGRISAMAENADGTLWAATNAGVFVRLDTKVHRVEEVATLGTRVLAGFQDRSGRVFLFTGRGVYLREGASSKAIPQRAASADTVLGEPSVIQSVQSGCEAPDGAVWLVGNNRIARFKDGSWTQPPISGLSRLTGTLLAVACARDGSLWTAGDEIGVWRLTAENGGLHARQLVLPTEWNSLAFLTAFEDRRGWLWLGTDLGFLVWNGQEWRHLYEETGLIWNDTNQGVIREDPDGSLWMGTSGGVAHLLHPEHVFDSISINVSLTQARRGAQDFTHAQKIVMPEEGPPLQLQVSSPLPRNLSELTLRLQMVGMNPDWVDTRDGTAAFTKLGPGSYTFKGMACNAGLNACSPAVSISVKVLPPWWKSYWFFSLCSLLLVAMVLAGVWLNARHLKKRSRELELLVQERTKELERSREQLRIQATHDGLTGMLNRVAIMNVLAEELERARRARKPFVLALADLDHFKRVNDTLGHMAGDEALRQFAAAINHAIRPYDHSGRYGGEEFLMVLTDLPRAAAEQRLALLHACISNLVVGSGLSEFRVTCSIGAIVVSPPVNPMSTEPLLASADEALYEAKASGRNQVIIRRFDASAPISDHSLYSAEPRS
jgi:diguanylate cyclase (GGDEF)-like protein